MAEKIVSPGVFTRENDLSFISQGIGEIGAVVIGPFHKGPAYVPTIVNTQSEFEEIFGTPDGTYYTGYAVQNYLREAGTATIVRVGHIGGYSHVAPIGIKVTLVSGSATTEAGVGSAVTVGTLLQEFTTLNSGAGTISSLSTDNFIATSVTTAHVTASGNISASGDIVGATGSFDIIFGGKF